MDENRFDPLIKKYASEHRLPWLLIKAQIWAESSFDPCVQSSHGAMGVMQLMPVTAREMGLDTHEIFEPGKNIEAGVKYDRLQYDHLPEIPRGDDRLHFMLASYNCGRSYVNQALRLAREVEFGYQPKVLRPGEWQRWSYTRPFLAVPGCRINGKGPDFIRVWDYVTKIWVRYQYYLQLETDSRPKAYQPDSTKGD